MRMDARSSLPIPDHCEALDLEAMNDDVLSVGYCPVDASTRRRQKAHAPPVVNVGRPAMLRDGAGGIQPAFTLCQGRTHSDVSQSVQLQRIVKKR